MAKVNNNKQKTEIVKDSLEDLLGGADIIDDIDDLDHVPKKSPIERHDYGKIRNDAEAKAKKTINSLLRFYLSEHLIEENQYIQAKSSLEEATLSTLIFQMKSAETAIIRLLNEIQGGEVSPRMFEVLGTLQKSMLDIVKSQTMYMVAAEEGIKKISREIDVFKSTDDGGSAIKKDPLRENTQRGTKELMRSIQDEIEGSQSVDIEDIESELDEPEN